MDLTRFDLRNFLVFHVKKGVEKSGLVAIRTSTLENMDTLNKPLLLTVEGEEGIMLLTNSTIYPRIVKTTKKVFGRGKKYGLARLHFRPTHEDTLMLMDKLQTLERNFIDNLEVTYKTLENKL